MGTHTQVSLSLDIAFGHLAQYMSWHMNELTTCLPACSCFLNFTPTCAFPDFRVGINSARVIEASRFGWVLIIDYVGLCIVYQSVCFSFLSPLLYRRLVRGPPGKFEAGGVVSRRSPGAASDQQSRYTDSSTASDCRGFADEPDILFRPTLVLVFFAIFCGDFVTAIGSGGPVSDKHSVLYSAT
jgi:hypothetical protein